jgi:hypothetical protein
MEPRSRLIVRYNVSYICALGSAIALMIVILKNPPTWVVFFVVGTVVTSVGCVLLADRKSRTWGNEMTLAEQRLSFRLQLVRGSLLITALLIFAVTVDTTESWFISVFASTLIVLKFLWAYKEQHARPISKVDSSGPDVKY